MFIAQMAIRFHCQHAAIFVPEPTRYSRNINAAFDATRCEEMPQRMMRDSFHPDSLHRAVNRFLALAYSENMIRETIIRKIPSHPLKQSSCVGQKAKAPDLAVLRAGLGISADHNSPEIEIYVAPSQRSRLSESTTSECQAGGEIGTRLGKTSVSFSHLVKQRAELRERW